MLQVLAFAVSAILVLTGIGLAAFGIVQAEFKQTAIGLVLILGAGVFATLYRGTRWSSRE